MLVSTARYCGKGVREDAVRFAAATLSHYCARGKKPFAQLVSMARKKGERRLAIFASSANGPGIDFAEITSSGWTWIPKRISYTKITFAEGAHDRESQGNDGALASIFGLDEFDDSGVTCKIIKRGGGKDRTRIIIDSEEEHVEIIGELGDFDETQDRDNIQSKERA